MSWSQRSFSDYAVPIGIALGWIALQWALRVLRTRKAQAWPVVEGRVERIRTPAEGYESYAEGPSHALYYSYSVQGEFYSGIQVLDLKTSTFDFPEGTHVLVHYKRSDPSVSSLDLAELQSRRGTEE